MGRKQIRAGKHLLFCLTGLILLGLTGCALLEKIQELGQPATSPAEKEEALKKREAASAEKKRMERVQALLLEGRKLFARRDFEGSIRALEEVTLLSNKSPSDEAFFYIGLIQADPGNPRKDYAKSLDSMKRLVQEYPQSLFVEQAKTWIDVLQMNDRLVKENEKLVQGHGKAVKDYQKLVKDHEKLTKMLKEYKQVDIEIEEKKREKGR